MDQLLKRRAEAEHAIKDIESFYAETVVKSISCTASVIPDATQICTNKVCLFPRSLQHISGRESQTSTAGSVPSWTGMSV